MSDVAFRESTKKRFIPLAVVVFFCTVSLPAVLGLIKFLSS